MPGAAANCQVIGLGLGLLLSLSPTGRHLAQVICKQMVLTTQQFNTIKISNKIIPLQSTANDKQRAPIRQDYANGVPAASSSTSPPISPCRTATVLYTTRPVPKIIHFNAQFVKKIINTSTQRLYASTQLQRTVTNDILVLRGRIRNFTIKSSEKCQTKNCQNKPDCGLRSEYRHLFLSFALC